MLRKQIRSVNLFFLVRFYGCLHRRNRSCSLRDSGRSNQYCVAIVRNHRTSFVSHPDVNSCVFLWWFKKKKFRSRFVDAERTTSKYLTRPWGAPWSRHLRSAHASSILSTWRRRNWCRVRLNLCRILRWWLSLVTKSHTISWSSAQAPHTRALQPRQSASKNTKLVGNNYVLMWSQGLV
jgi:hypothetical protein